MTAPRRIEGYAIVSDDGMLADADRVMPESLRFDADQAFFAEGLDRVDVVVHGRHSHEGQPQSPRRRRLIVSDRIRAIAPDPKNSKALRWNPRGATIEEALAEVGAPGGSIGVVGATNVFALFLDRYDVFYLTRAPGVTLPGGRPIFPGVPDRTPEEVLAFHGLVAGERRMLDARQNLAVVSWERRP